MESIAARASLVTDVQRYARRDQPLDQLPDRIVLVGDRAEETHFASAPSIGNRDRDGFLMHI